MIDRARELIAIIAAMVDEHEDVHAENATHEGDSAEYRMDLDVLYKGRQFQVTYIVTDMGEPDAD